MNQIIFFIAIGLFAASAGRLLYQKAHFSPQFVAAVTFVIMGVSVILPQLVYSETRQTTLGMRTQIFLLISAATLFGTVLYMRKPELLPEYPTLRWRILPRLGWLFVFLVICVADPIVSYKLYGTVGLIQGNQGMGTGGGGNVDVFTPLTFIAWSCASMAVSMVMTDFLFSFRGYLAFLRKRYIDVGIVIGCLASTTLSGNRFVLICQLLSLCLGLAMFSRLKVWMVVAVALFLATFFVVVGNFRFGKLDVSETLEHTTGNTSVDKAKAWLSDYTEPNLLNLDAFLRDQPGMMWGMDWVTTVLPSGILDKLNVDRTNSAQWLSDNKLYAYHGLTFRTMYPDLIMDFGYKGALILGGVFLMLGARIYNRALLSPHHFLLFLAYAPLILIMPLAAAFYALPNLVPFGLLLLAYEPRKSSGRRRPVGGRAALPLSPLQQAMQQREGVLSSTPGPRTA
jgi:oligosaccharide repeat unit polymerase